MADTRRWYNRLDSEGAKVKNHRRRQELLDQRERLLAQENPPEALLKAIDDELRAIEAAHAL